LAAACEGTYTIRRATITFVTRTYGSVESFAFVLDRHGFLRLRPVVPMDRGDQSVMAGKPWRRVGPPRTLR
jgi:hypothetical protein